METSIQPSLASHWAFLPTPALSPLAHAASVDEDNDGLTGVLGGTIYIQ